MAPVAALWGLSLGPVVNTPSQLCRQITIETKLNLT